MARERDEAKRRALLAAAKRLFAERGFHGTSVSDLARATDLPVGSIYTYFESKEKILSTVIEEGWADFFSGLSRAIADRKNPEEGLSFIIDEALPGLFRDIDLISLLLIEAGQGGFAEIAEGLDDKLERLALLVADLVNGIARKNGSSLVFSAAEARTAVCLFFLGSLYTVKLSRSAGLKVGEAEILGFIRSAALKSLGVDARPTIRQ